MAQSQSPNSITTVSHCCHSHRRKQGRRPARKSRGRRIEARLSLPSVTFPFPFLSLLRF